MGFMIRSTGLAALVAILVYSQAFPCECGWLQVKDGKRELVQTPPPLTIEEYASYPAVFRGTVKRLDSEPNCTDCEPETIVATFEVQKAWRGQIEKVYQVRTPGAGTACKYTFILGETYLVYVKEGTKAYNYGVDRCSRTKLVSAATEELGQLDLWKSTDVVNRQRRNP